jgi:ribosomal protein S3
MGQKVNPLIFRMGSKNKLWDSKYLGKDPEEFSYYLFQDLQIEDYINTVFKLHNMIIYNYVIKRSTHKLNIFIDFYTTSKVSIKALYFFSNISNFKSRVLRVQKHKRRSRVFFFNFISIKNKLKNQFQVNKHLKQTSMNQKKFFFSYSKLKLKMIETVLKFSKVFKLSFHLNNIQNETINNFYKSKNVNLKSIVQGLNSYSREKFFNEMIEIMIIIFTARNTSKLLTSFIAFQFQMTKRHNTFLTFLKRAISLLNSIQYFKIYGIKIIISGKFNGASRSKKRTIQTGRLPLQNFNSRISYHCTHAHTPYGTFGVKVWVCEKEKSDLVENDITTKTNKIPKA